MYIGRYLGVVDYAFLLILIISSCSATPLEGLWAFLLSLGLLENLQHNHLKIGQLRMPIIIVVLIIVVVVVVFVFTVVFVFVVAVAATATDNSAAARGDPAKVAIQKAGAEPTFSMAHSPKPMSRFCQGCRGKPCAPKHREDPHKAMLIIIIDSQSWFFRLLSVFFHPLSTPFSPKPPLCPFKRPSFSSSRLQGQVPGRVTQWTRYACIECAEKPLP